MTRQPAIFISHGAPTFALEPGRAGALLRGTGARWRPRAIVVLSPHWLTRDLAVTSSARPRTIHDFGGFAKPLYELQYPAPGAPALAQRIVMLLAAAGISLRTDPERGLDHGAWVLLMHLYPDAGIPVVQVSMPASLEPQEALRLGELLAPLRDEGVMIVGSGSLTHNLGDVFSGSAEGDAHYAQAFVAWAREAVCKHDWQALVDYLHVAPHARRAHPTSDHYLPLLFAAGAGGLDAQVEVLDGDMTFAVLSMESYVFL